MDPVRELAQDVLRRAEQPEERVLASLLERQIASWPCEMQRQWKRAPEQERVCLLADSLYVDGDAAVTLARSSRYPQFVESLAAQALSSIRLQTRLAAGARMVASQAPVMKQLLSGFKEHPLIALAGDKQIPSCEGSEDGPFLDAMKAALMSDFSFMTRVAELLEGPVPFSFVLDRELHEIVAHSRPLRRQIDPDVWTCELTTRLTTLKREAARVRATGHEGHQSNLRVEELDRNIAAIEKELHATEPLLAGWRRLLSIERRLVEFEDCQLRHAGHGAPVAEAIESLLAAATECKPSLKAIGEMLTRLETYRDITDLGRSEERDKVRAVAAALLQKVQEARAALEQKAAQRRATLEGPTSVPAPQADGSRNPFVRAARANLMGLAFSGGGIRSATFNLGVLQGLADLGVLRHVDYLSTVSGGGYIGAWLTAWCKRAPGGIRSVQAYLSPQLSPNPDADEVRPIRFLREYSNYLTPQAGFFSADTWTMIATWLRNTMLNQLVLILFLGGMLLLPRLAAAVLDTFNDGAMHSLAFFALLVGAMLMVGLNMYSFDQMWRINYDPPAEPSPAYSKPASRRPWIRRLAVRLTKQGSVQLFVVIPVFAAGLIGAALLRWWTVTDKDLDETRLAFLFGPVTSVVEWLGVSWDDYVHWAAAILAAMTFFVGFVLAGLAGRYWRCFYSGGNFPYLRRARATFWVVACSAIASIAGGLMMLPLSQWFGSLDSLDSKWLVIVFGTPLLVDIFALSVMLQVGLLGRNFPDERREWWSRLGAWLMIYSIGWVVVCSIAIYGPLWLAMTGSWLASGAAFTWIATTAGGVLASKSGSVTGKEKSASLTTKGLNALARIAPYVFIGGLLVAIAFAVHVLLIRFNFTPENVPLWVKGHVFNFRPMVFPEHPEFSVPSLDMLWFTHWYFLANAGFTTIAGWPLPTPFVLMAVLLALSFLLALRIDVNEFSMHHAYKNRLVRAYMGASRTDRRKPNRFTGFDSGDDIKLASLRHDDPVNAESLKTQVRHYTGPYPIINTALNLVKGDDLAWQERRAQSFFFTPHYSGYDYRKPPGAVANGLAQQAFRPTRRFGYGDENGVAVGTAVAISGAAANPNMGYHTSPAATFLMTMFNARLGWWFGNPRHPRTWTRSSPRRGLMYLLWELTGQTNNRSPFINLSDGGHFENLGVYELVRRRCRYIIACDGEQDGDLQFGGLANAIRKCRTDFGVDIDIDLEQLRRRDGSRFSNAHCVVGKIKYYDAPQGTLLYVKASLTRDEPADLREYADREESFPHQTTGDQWFDESQFESYRALGHHVATAALGRALGTRDLTTSAEDVFKYAEILWYPPTAGLQEHFVKHAEALDGLLERLRQDGALSGFDEVVFKGMSEGVPPHRTLTHRRGFYFMTSLIQLMENVYFELRLEEAREHPYNSGWIEVFRHWAAQPEFIDVWRKTSSGRSARFRRFCQDEFNLPG